MELSSDGHKAASGSHRGGPSPLRGGDPTFGASGAFVCLRVVSYLGKYRQEGWPLYVLVLTMTSQPLELGSCLKLFPM